MNYVIVSILGRMIEWKRFSIAYKLLYMERHNLSQVGGHYLLKIEKLLQR